MTEEDYLLAQDLTRLRVAYTTLSEIISFNIRYLLIDLDREIAEARIKVGDLS